jgi:hypothetical protein
MRAVLVTATVFFLASACETKPKPVGSKSEPPPTPAVASVASSPAAASASASPPDTEKAEASAYPKRTTDAWPLDMDNCSATPCKLPDGTPGLSCKPGQACFNPCPAGMGPEGERWYCAKLCKSSADCGKDPCENGVCNRWPKHACKDPQDNCTTPDGQQGFRCSAKDKCLPMCKRGLSVYGGTHCAKACKGDKACPGGSCEEGFCVPLCPSEGCPYRWE